MNDTVQELESISGSLRSLFVHFLFYSKRKRNNNLDSDNIPFHRDNELCIKLPLEWRDIVSENILGALEDAEILGEKALDNLGTVLIFYSDTACYKKSYQVNKKYEKIVEYCSYYEFQCAILNSVSDIREQERIRDMISCASAVIVLDASRCQSNVLNAVRQFTCGSLILVD